MEDQGKHAENDRLMGNIEPKRMPSAEIEDGDILSAKVMEKSVFFNNAVQKKADEKEEYPREKRKIVTRCKERRRKTEIGGKVIYIKKIGKREKPIAEKGKVSVLHRVGEDKEKKGDEKSEEHRYPREDLMKRDHQQHGTSEHRQNTEKNGVFAHKKKSNERDGSTGKKDGDSTAKPLFSERNAKTRQDDKERTVRDLPDVRKRRNEKGETNAKQINKVEKDVKKHHKKKRDPS